MIQRKKKKMDTNLNAEENADANVIAYTKQTERWGMAEVACHGPEDGNPFLEQSIRGHFCGEQETVTVDGFYDGGGIYKVRFMRQRSWPMPIALFPGCPEGTIRY